MMTDTMKHIFGVEIIEPGLKMLRGPGESGLKQCQEFARMVVEEVAEKKG